MFVQLDCTFEKTLHKKIDPHVRIEFLFFGNQLKSYVTITYYFITHITYFRMFNHAKANDEHDEQDA